MGGLLGLLQAYIGGQWELGGMERTGCYFFFGSIKKSPDSDERVFKCFKSFINLLL